MWSFTNILICRLSKRSAGNFVECFFIRIMSEESRWNLIKLRGKICRKCFQEAGKRGKFNPQPSLRVNSVNIKLLPRKLSKWFFNVSSKINLCKYESCTSSYSKIFSGALSFYYEQLVQLL